MGVNMLPESMVVRIQLPNILNCFHYAIGDTESEDSGPEDKHNSEPESESAENDEIFDIINMYSY